jgi:hypothetical protein
MDAHCKHWREDEDDFGAFEYCAAMYNRSTACCGSLPQCRYPLLFNVADSQLSAQREATRELEARELGRAYAIGGYKG